MFSQCAFMRLRTWRNSRSGALVPDEFIDCRKERFSVDQWGNTATLTARRSGDLSLLDLIAGLYLDNKWWMRLSLSHPPESRRLLVAGSVCWIISGLDLGEPLQAGGMDFGYP